jgi:archaellum component FlaF (FlaF/FlaG flagellin family)
VNGKVVEGWDYQVSAGGRYTVFATLAQVTDIVPPESEAQVYLYDRLNDRHELVSAGTSGEPAKGWCEPRGISADGRFVLSSCIDLNGSDPRAAGLFVRDRVAKTTQRVSSESGGSRSALSGDARYVAFIAQTALVPSDTNGTVDVYLWDRRTLVTERVTVGYGAGQPNGTSFFPGLSDDGRFVVFTSTATNLVPGDTNGRHDVFVRDRLNQQTHRVSVNSNGAQANGTSLFSVISANGQVVGFSSDASNLVPGDRNNRPDHFVHDLATGQTERVNVSSSGQATTDGDTLPTDMTVSGDGRFVSFASRSARLVPDDTNYDSDVFVRDRQARTTVRASVNTAGTQANSDAYAPVISRNGSFVVFQSAATNLTTRPIEAYGTAVYLHEITHGVAVPVTLSPTTVRFGTVAVGTLSDVRLVTMTNTSGKSVALQAINLGGPSPEQFSRVRRCPALLAVGESCIVEVRFAPTSPGSSTAKLIVNAGTEYPKAFAWLNGTGL